MFNTYEFLPFAVRLVMLTSSVMEIVCLLYKPQATHESMCETKDVSLKITSNTDT